MRRGKPPTPLDAARGRRRAAAVAVFLAAALLCAGAGAAQEPGRSRSWREEKCARYKRDWSEALRRFGADGLSRPFLEANAAFIGSGCMSGDKACPRTARDLRLVDVMTIRVVNEGMSSTFLPFGCPKT